MIVLDGMSYLVMHSSLLTALFAVVLLRAFGVNMGKSEVKLTANTLIHK